MQRRFVSPIRETLETWPLAGAYRMRWGADEAGEMWVTVENRDGDCEAVLPYRTYIEMGDSRRAVQVREREREPR